MPDLVRSAFTEPLVQCDAFTAEAGTGNAAAVVFSQRKGDAKWMQKDRSDRASQGLSGPLHCFSMSYPISVVIRHGCFGICSHRGS